MDSRISAGNPTTVGREHDWRFRGDGTFTVLCDRCGVLRHSLSSVLSCATETQADGATAPNRGDLLIYDEMSDMPPGFWERVAKQGLCKDCDIQGSCTGRCPAKAPERAVQRVPELGHALRTVNRPSLPCDLATRFVGRVE